ncbi:TMEM105 isoform 2, partial [Pongo abelii]
TLLKVRRASLKPPAAPHQAWLRPPTLLQGPTTSPQGAPPRPPWGDCAEPSCLCEMKIRR